MKQLDEIIVDGKSIIECIREEFLSKESDFEELLLFCKDNTKKIIKELGLEWC